MNAYKDKEAMPYERFLKFGAESLTDTELLAIILRTGTKEKNALELAGDILHLQGNMQGKLGTSSAFFGTVKEYTRNRGSEGY